MASLDFLALGTPVSEEAACGPDLDLEGDADYMNFVARAEGVLPTTFFSGPDGKPFDRSSIDFNAEFDAIAPLLQRTRDLRLLVILAKLLLLNRDIADSSAASSALPRWSRNAGTRCIRREWAATSGSEWRRWSRSTTCRRSSFHCSICRSWPTTGLGR